MGKDFTKRSACVVCCLFVFLHILEIDHTLLI